MSRTNKNLKVLKIASSKQSNHPDSWEKIQALIEKEEAKEDLIDIQEEIENAFLETINFNWRQMSFTEKKLAIQLGCLVKNLKKGLEEAFEKSLH